MKLLLENWRKLLNEISFEDAKKRLETKALTKWIKGMAFDEETKTMTLNPDQVEKAKKALAEVVLQFVPQDITDNQQGTSLEWIISVGINDATMKPRFYNEAISTVAPGNHSIRSALLDVNIKRGDLERYWQTHDYSDQKDIFSIENWGALSWAADKAKKKYDDAIADKEYLDADKGIEVFRDDDEWRIYALHNKGAACKFGKGTEWCTAAPGLNYFEEYYDDEDPLFYFEDKENGKRWQFHFGSDQFMDEKDREVDDAERDFFIDLLAKTGAAKKYQIVQYWVTKNEVAQTIYGENTTPEELMAIAKKYAGNGEEEIMEMIIDSDNVTKEVLEYIVLNDGEYGANALSNPKLTNEFINSLAYSEDTNLRYMASYAYDFGGGIRDDALSDEALDKLSEDPERYIRMRIAMHPFAPPETLTKMANRLMKDEAEQEHNRGAMVSNLLKNDNLPTNLITPLIEWSKTQPNNQMLGKPFDAKIFKDTLAPSAMLAAAQSQNTPAEILGEIGDVFFDSDTGFEMAAMHALTTNKNTPKDLLLKLTKHSDGYVRDTAKKALQKLADQTEMDSLRENFKRFLK